MKTLIGKIYMFYTAFHGYKYLFICLIHIYTHKVLRFFNKNNIIHKNISPVIKFFLIFFKMHFCSFFQLESSLPSPSRALMSPLVVISAKISAVISSLAAESVAMFWDMLPMTVFAPLVLSSSSTETTVGS